MNGELFLRAVGGIDDDLVMEAHERRPAGRVPRRIRAAGTAAACLVLAAGVLLTAPLLWRSGSDNASKESADMGRTDEKLYSSAADGEFADVYETVVENTAAGAPADPGETQEETRPALETGTVPDTGVGSVVRSRTFWFCEDGTWRTETHPYPDGLPGMESIVSDYLRAAGTDVRCTAVSCAVTGEKDEVIGCLVVHTVGVTTWTVTLDGDPGEDIRRGLTNTVLDSRVHSSLYQVVIRTPDTEYPSHGAYEY